MLECSESLTIARQKGALAARTRWLLFADADVEFAPGYFDALASLPSGQDRAVRRCCSGRSSRADDYEGHYRRLAVAQRVLAALRIPAASGSNMLVTAEAFAAV